MEVEGGVLAAAADALRDEDAVEGWRAGRAEVEEEEEESWEGLTGRGGPKACSNFQR